MGQPIQPGDLQFVTREYYLDGGLDTAKGSTLTFEELDTTLIFLSNSIANAGSSFVGLTSASVDLNKIYFTKSDASTFSITVDTGSGKTTNTGSLLLTASANSNIITFSKGDASQFTITIDTGSNFVSYNFTASFSNQSTWTVNHNLGYQYVIIQTFDTSGNQILPSEITLTNTNTATATFPEATSGTAVVTFGGATFNNPTLPAGSNRQLQYNDGGVFGASSKMQFDGTEFALFNADESATALTTGGNIYYSSTEIFHNRTPSEGFIQNFIDNKIQTGEIFSFGNTSATQYDLVYLNGSTWASVDQADNTKATQLLAIYDSSGFITEGYITIGVAGSTSDVPTIDGNTAAEGRPVYIDEGATSAPFLTTDVPTTGIVRVLGHLMYKQGDYYLMRFRPDHTWVEIV